MTAAFAIKTVLELAAILLVVVGIMNEKKLIIFEENVTRIIKRKVRMYKRRKALEKKRAQGQHLRVVQTSRRPAPNSHSVA